jgi:hypothetical protein
MKKMPTNEKDPSTENEPDALETERHFDYTKAKPNRFAAQLNRESVVVVLDPDVAEVFKTPEAVNKILRALIASMPTSAK